VHLRAKIGHPVHLCLLHCLIVWPVLAEQLMLVDCLVGWLEDYKAGYSV
jgi:hypothetical protein